MSVRRRSFLSTASLAAFAVGTMPASAADDGTVWHVAIFQFEADRVPQAIDGCARCAARRASRGEPIVERRASPAALAARQRTPIFTAVGRNVLERYAVFHVTVPGTPLTG